MKKSITNYLDEVGKIYKNKSIFIENKDKKISYSKFINESKIIATNILKNKSIYNKPIAIFIDKSIETLTSMFGIMYSGNFYTVLDTTSPETRINTIINTLNPEYIITNNKNIEKINKKNIPIIKISTKTREGIDDLYKEISRIFKLNELASNGEIIISNNRHKYLIKSAHEEIKQAQESIENNMPSEIISTNIRNALEELGKITGETVTDDVIKEIFSKFCLGK